jgi:glycosyltransferase involved in cell wall biosynthesis
MKKQELLILGIRGVPAQHGGFETFAEHFAVYLQKKGWQVTVYCQEEGGGEIYEDEWRGIHRVHIPVANEGAKYTVIFDWKSTWHAMKRRVPVLTLGYNTAIFCILYRLMGVLNVINMDGIEWHRGKWNVFERMWLYVNEKLGAWLGNHLIADHPEIKKHLEKFTNGNKITVIPYSADVVENADASLIEPYGLETGKYNIIIARPEQENSILEIVKAYSKKKRGVPLVVLGKYSVDTNPYHKEVIDSAGDEVKFVGAIYDQEIVQALRFYARFYVHGHTVGGTNPSLVEALGAGSAVLAHGNKFNHWVAGSGARYFSTEEECAQELDELLQNDELIEMMKRHSIQQFRENFTWDKIHGAYEDLLIQQSQKQKGLIASLDKPIS